MHLSRIVVLLGAVLAVVGLAIKALTLDGEDALPGLNAVNDAFPDGIPTIYGGLETWVKVVVVTSLVLVVIAALLPPLRDPERLPGAIFTTLVGIAFFAYAIVKYNETLDDADALQEGFDFADRLGLLPEGVGNVEVSVGFFVLMAATAIVAIGGVLGIVAARKQSSSSTA
jgi:hypothetical protein